MPKTTLKFDPELVSEMTWSEYILAASDDHADTTVHRWTCVGCEIVFQLDDNGDLVTEAQAFLDSGWAYRHKVKPDVGFVAVCLDCRHKKRK